MLEQLLAEKGFEKLLNKRDVIFLKKQEGEDIIVRLTNLYGSIRCRVYFNQDQKASTTFWEPEDKAMFNTIMKICSQNMKT